MNWLNYCHLFLLGVALNAFGNCKIERNNNRSGRWFLFPRTVTKWINAKSVITESIPSSCAVVQPSLAPCRHVRQLNIQPSTTVKILQTEAAHLPPSDIAAGPKFFSTNNNNFFQLPSLFGSRGDEDEQPVPESISTLQDRRDEQSQGYHLQLQRHKPLSWSEYFLGYNTRNADIENKDVLKTGPIRTNKNNNKTTDQNQNNNNNNYDNGFWYNFGGFLEPDVTITKTVINSVTAKYLDPKTVVTFSVKGCHPSKLPFNLPLCDTAPVSLDIIANSSIISTPQVHSSITKDVHFVPN